MLQNLSRIGASVAVTSLSAHIIPILVEFKLKLMTYLFDSIEITKDFDKQKKI